MLPKIKVLIVDDSALVRQMLQRALSLEPRIEIVGVASTGVEAIERARQLQPDVITLDIEMPELTGLEALPHLMRATPARVVMLSSVDNADTTYQALYSGAVDFIVKPRTGVASSLTELSDVLVTTIKTASRIHPEKRGIAARSLAAAKGVAPSGRVTARRIQKVVGIAASTGGPPALEALFSGLTCDLPAAYVVVQHLPAGFAASLARRLSRVSDIEFSEAHEDEALRAGRAYVAPHGMHITLAEHSALPSLKLFDGPPIHGVRPAADPLFESVAREFGKRAIGVVLTGMGSDGAAGLRQIRESGGETIVQDEETSVVWGMPKAAVRLGAATHVVPLGKVASEIRRAVRE